MRYTRGVLPWHLIEFAHAETPDRGPGTCPVGVRAANCGNWGARDQVEPQLIRLDDWLAIGTPLLGWPGTPMRQMCLIPSAKMLLLRFQPRLMDDPTLRLILIHGQWIAS